MPIKRLVCEEFVAMTPTFERYCQKVKRSMTLKSHLVQGMKMNAKLESQAINTPIRPSHDVSLLTNNQFTKLQSPSARQLSIDPTSN
jgi:hypothetical protein